MTRLEIAFGPWVVARRWWLIAFTLLAVCITGGGMLRIGFEPDLRAFFNPDDPQVLALDALEATYTRNDTVFFAVAPKNGDVFTRDTLSALAGLTDLSWRMPFAMRVDSLNNFPHTYAEGDDLIVEEIAPDPSGYTDADLARIRAIALAEPDLVNRLVSPSGDVAGVAVTLAMPHEAVTEVAEVSAYARAAVRELEADHPDIAFHLTGGVMIDNAFAEIGKDDMVTLVPLMYLLLMVIIGLALRSVWGTMAVLLVILFSLATAMGMAGWTGILLNAATVAAPTIILSLAVADSVHILATVRRHMLLGTSRHEAVALAVSEDLRPVLITSATTVIGFLSMNLSGLPPFRDLGNLVAVGISAAFLYSILFLPSLLALLPLRVAASADACDCGPCDPLARFVIRRRRMLLWGTVAVAVLCATGLPRIELNDEYIKYFGERYEVRRASDFVERRLTGWNTIEYSIPAKGPGGIHEPGYLERLDAFATWLRTQPKVVHVHTLSDTMKRLNRNMHGDDPAWYRLPDERELAAQYLLLYELSLPFGLDLNDRINVDKSATRLTVTLTGVSTRELLMADRNARAWLTANAPPYMLAQGTGLSMLWAHMSQKSIYNMLTAAFGALVLISFLLVAAIRSVGLGLLSLIPNLFPALMAFGIWGWMTGWVGIGLSVVVSMTIGVVVDDTVHFITRYARARREEGKSPERAVTNAFHTVGTPLWITTVALVAGFLVLTLSGYRMNADMGAVSAMTITVALALDFLFLPALLLTVDRKKATTAPAPADEQCALFAGGCRCPACTG